MRRPEQQLQIAIARYLDLVLPSDAFFFHAPNGGKRTRAEGGIFKAMGVKSGVPDLCIIKEGRAYWIELKAPGGKATEIQDSIAAQLITAGCQVMVAHSIDEVQRALTMWGIKTRLAA